MPRRKSNDQRVTIYLPNGAIAGRILRVSETGLIARLESEVPRGEPFAYTLHLPGAVVSGEVRSLGQEGRVCRLQFGALTTADRRLLDPWIEEDTGVLSADEEL